MIAEEYLERIGHDKDVICESMFGKPYLQSNVSDLMESYAKQYARIKVLEALDKYQEQLSEGYDQETFEWHVKQLIDFKEKNDYI